MRYSEITLLRAVIMYGIFDINMCEKCRVFLRVLFVIIGLFALTKTASIHDSYRVAGLFEPDHEALELAFKSAIETMNLRQIVGINRLIVYHTESTIPHDSFEANKKVCRQLQQGIAAVFGPISKIPRAHVQSICNAFGIPHLQAQWDSRDPRDYYSISVYPDHQKLSEAYAALIKYWGWKQFTIIYEDNDSLIRLQEVLKATKGNEYKVTVRKLDALQSSYISMFKDVKEKHEYHIIIDCDVTKVKSILHEALKVNMLSEYYHFHFTTLDLGLVDLDDYKYGGANVTAMRLIDPSRPEVIEVKTDWTLKEEAGEKSPLLGGTYINTELALMFDAVHLFALGLSELIPVQPVKTETLSCSKRAYEWDSGSGLLNFMKLMDFEGLSGRIRFDEEGRRIDFNLDIIELTQNGLRKVGSWMPGSGINMEQTYHVKKKENADKLTNTTLRVVTVYEEPYLSLNKEGSEPKHVGFMIDLLDLISKRLGFKYVVYEQKEKQFGAEDPPGSGRWNGMIGDLMERDPLQRADLAAAGMTITYEREGVVDFTKPFLNLGITIIYKKPVKSPPKLFSFLSPLSLDVWIYMLAAYLCVSFMMFVIARFSPYEWTNPHPCNEDSDLVENQFTILNSLWFTIGSLMQQGCEIAPRAISTRMVACLWWFFTLIMISSYTANLAAFLTVERMDSPIESAEDLAKQTRIKYGTQKDGSTYSFFKNSDVPTFKDMWRFMDTHSNEAFVNGSRQGVNRVKNSNYAFLAESTTIDYQVQKNCDLTQIGGLLDSKGYGIATPKDSPWTEFISNEVIFFQENQQIQKLYTKWWKEKNGNPCVVDEKKGSSALGVKNVGGVFVVLIGGLIAGLILACMEFMWKARKNARVDKQTFCSEISEELRFAVRCFGGSTKANKRRPSKDVLDNGIQFAPLTGISNNRNHKEMYA